MNHKLVRTALIFLLAAVAASAWSLAYGGAGTSGTTGIVVFSDAAHGADPLRGAARLPD